MITILKTLDLKRNTTAFLENAFAIGYEKVSNQIWSASFSLPINDPKVSKVQLLKYVEIVEGDDEETGEPGEYIGLFRIIPKQTRKSANTVTFQCEHVLATLLNSTLFKYHQVSNFTTKEVLQYLINQQKEKNWKLGTVEFTRYFHYSWENENLLSAIFSVPNPFDEQYRWTWDTSSYPWTLNLIKPDTEPTCRIKEGHNLIDLTIEENPMSVFNRIYPLGVGEGVNQLTIESVNNGIPYIEDTKSISENGIMETVWVDRRFENVESLKANAEALLKKWKDPIVTWEVSAADVSKITGTSIDELKEGKVVRLQLEDYPEVDLRIMKEVKRDMIGDPGAVQLEIGNLTEDLSTTQSDLERRQQINELYSQGATNILNSDRVENADPTHPIKFKIRIPEDAVNVNFMELTWETEKFRGYTRGVKGGGAFVKSSTVQSKSTEAGGAFVKSSTVQSKSTEGGGAYVKDSEVKTTNTHNLAGSALTRAPVLPEGVYPGDTTHWHSIDPQWFAHSHTITIPGISIAAHTHNFSITIPEINIPSHSHGFNVTIPEINIPSHVHETEYGIYEHEDLPTKLEIKVDGTIIPHTALQGENVDLTPYLQKDQNGRVSRDRFALIEIRPVDELAQISANVIWGLFVQSHKGVTL